MKSSQRNSLLFTTYMLAGCSLMLPAVSFRETRISQAQSIYLWDLHFVIPVLLLSLIVLSAFFSNKNNNLYLLTTVLYGATPLLFLSLASNLFVKEAEYARISLASGSWAIVFLAYILLYGKLKDKTNMFSTLWYYVIPVSTAIILFTNSIQSFSLLLEFQNNSSRFFQETINHLIIAGIAVAIGIFIGLAAGILSYKIQAIRSKVMYFFSIIQTIPGLALFGLLIPLLAIILSRFPVLRDGGLSSIGVTPAIIALSLYAVLPIARNTLSGLESISPAVIEAAQGVGMNSVQQLKRIFIPLSMPIILAGIRTSAIQTIGNTTLAALIGAGGLGVFIFQGLGQAAPDLILLGAIPIILLALGADQLMSKIIISISPKTGRREKS